MAGRSRTTSSGFAPTATPRSTPRSFPQASWHLWPARHSTLRKPTPIGAKLADTGGNPIGYDHNFVLSRHDTDEAVAEVTDPKSGRWMKIYTDQPGLQFYSGNFLDGTVTGKNGDAYRQYEGFCLETQHFPDAANHPKFPPVVLRPGEIYRTKSNLRLWCKLTMKRFHIPGFVDLFKVSDPKEIHALAQDPRVDRKFGLRTCPLNWFLLSRSLSVLSVDGDRFPHHDCPRQSAEEKAAGGVMEFPSRQKATPSGKARPNLSRWPFGFAAPVPMNKQGFSPNNFSGSFFFLNSSPRRKAGSRRRSSWLRPGQNFQPCSGGG